MTFVYLCFDVKSYKFADCENRQKEAQKEKCVQDMDTSSNICYDYENENNYEQIKLEKQTVLKSALLSTVPT